MRINFEKENTSIRIRDISVGETFFAQRASIKEVGLYMKIDGASGIVRQNKYGHNYAVNLASGQLREFSSDTLVEKAPAEVNFLKRG